VLVHVNAGDGGFAHADARSPVPRDQATEELEEIGIVADEHDVLAVRVLINQLLEVGENILHRLANFGRRLRQCGAEVAWPNR